MQQNFLGGTISFFTLTGTGTQNDIAIRQGGIPRRSLSFVTYSGGTRTELWMGEQGPLRTLTRDTCSFRAYKADASGNVTPASGMDFPAFVTVHMQATSELSSSYDVGAASAGPDRIFGSGSGDSRGRDDIRTWVEGQ